MPLQIKHLSQSKKIALLKSRGYSNEDIKILIDAARLLANGIKIRSNNENPPFCPEPKNSLNAI